MAGEPLLEGKLAPQLSGQGGIMPMLVPEGQRAVTIKVDDAVREAGFVLPNSRVDVFVSMAKAANSQDRVGKMILQDVVVLAAGQAVEMRDNRPVSVTTVTLALTPEQAERLALAQNEGKLTIGMRNLRDKQIIQTAGATRDTLLGATPVPKPAAGVVKPAATKKAPASDISANPLPAPKIATHAVAVIRSGKVSEQVFVRSGDEWIEHSESKK